MNQCRVPTRSITALYTMDGVAICGMQLTNVLSSMSCASIICFNTSCVDVNVVIDSDILSQTLSAMVLKSSLCNIAWYVGLELFFFFLGEFLMSIVLGHFSLIVALPLSFSLAFSWSRAGSFSCSFPFSFSFSFSSFSFGFSSYTTHITGWSFMTCSMSSWVIL